MDTIEENKLPENVNFPLRSVEDMDNLEEVLGDSQVAASLWTLHEKKYCMKEQILFHHGDGGGVSETRVVADDGDTAGKCDVAGDGDIARTDDVAGVWDVAGTDYKAGDGDTAGTCDVAGYGDVAGTDNVDGDGDTAGTCDVAGDGDVAGTDNVDGDGDTAETCDVAGNGDVARPGDDAGGGDRDGDMAWNDQLWGSVRVIPVEQGMPVAAFPMCSTVLAIGRFGGL
ncbi:cysteine-rich, acidic integral membrane protein-like [Mercenaria mercenaria]|uniref:cysteine-rich, acidic integral membrane protein-like n=1 Tax=Mercenaria mercenaria TaxID=6596 RepID=UPI00234E9163|nr:cysteine-rich, acidic integral membrane protein-like [Mercenaria mercenaria]